MMCKTTRLFFIYQKYTMCSVEKRAILLKRLDICNNTTNLIESWQKSKFDHRLQVCKISARMHKPIENERLLLTQCIYVVPIKRLHLPPGGKGLIASRRAALPSEARQSISEPS